MPERPKLDGPPALPRTRDGRNLVFDMVARLCEANPDSRGSEIGQAVGRISKLQWQEVTSDEARWNFHQYPDNWAAFLCGVVSARVEMYHRTMNGADITPRALAKWWADLPGKDERRRSGKGLTPREIADMGNE